MSGAEAKRLAFFIFWNVLGPAAARHHLEAADLEPFLGGSKDEAKEAFRYFDVAGAGKITIKGMADAVLRIYGEIDTDTYPDSSIWVSKQEN